MENAIIVAVIVVIIGGAAWYVYKSKKRGDACVGCPHAKQCGEKCRCGDEKKDK